MPRNPSGQYNLPAGVIVSAGEVIQPSQHNPALQDIAQDLNDPRPIASGGTGATSATAARANLGATTTGDAVFIAADQAAGRTALGLGTIATQAASSVSITGGTLSGVTVGATSASVTAAEFPSVDMVATTSNSGWRIVRLVRGVNNFAIAILTQAGVFVSNAYEITLGAAGATAHIFRVDNAERFRVDSTVRFNGFAPISGGDVSLNGRLVSGGGAARDLGAPGGFEDGRIANIFLVNAPNVLSDERLKENFAPYTETDLAAARLFQPQTFTIKSTGEPSSGYRAQQIIAAFVEAGADERRPFELGLVSDGEHYGVCYELVSALRIEALMRGALT